MKTFKGLDELEGPQSNPIVFEKVFPRQPGGSLMDISSVNINYNAVNRTAFTSSADESDNAEQTTARAKQGQNGVSPDAQLSQIPPANEAEALAKEQGRIERQNHSPSKNHINLLV